MFQENHFLYNYNSPLFSLIFYATSISENHTALHDIKIAAGNLICLEEKGYYKK